MQGDVNLQATLTFVLGFLVLPQSAFHIHLLPSCLEISEVERGEAASLLTGRARKG